MINLIPLLFVIIVVLVDIILVLLVNHYLKRINYIFKRNKSNTIEYSKSILIGLVSGTIVVVFDRVISLAIDGLPSLDTSSIYSLFASLVGILLITIFLSASLLLAFLFLFYSGLRSIIKK